MSYSKKHVHRFGKLALILAAAAVSTSLYTCEQVRDYCRPTGLHYDPSCQFCFAGKPIEFCPSDGKKQYNPLTQGCDESGRIGMMCADESVSASGTPCGGFTLSVGAAPAGGGTVTVVGDNANRASFDKDASVVISAEQVEGYRFVGWAGSTEDAIATGGSLALRMNAHKSVVAMFRSGSAAPLVVSAFPPDAGKVSIANGNPAVEVSAPAEYGEGETVPVKATPEPGYTFKSWTGATTSDPASKTTTVTMEGGTTLVAIFEPAVYTLTVSANPVEGGAVFINGSALEAGQQQNGAGARVEVLAQPAAGYVFTHWSGGTLGSTNNLDTIEVTGSDMTLIANFRKSSVAEPTTYELKVDVQGNGTVSVNGAEAVSTYTKRHNQYTQVSVIATPNEGYGFTRWSGASTSNSPSITITMDGNKTVTANFTDMGSGDPPQTGDGTLIYGSKTYKTVKIGGLWWMAENLNYAPLMSMAKNLINPTAPPTVPTATGNSWCYDTIPDNCAKYGRLYTWEAANSACQGIGGGWHLPDSTEWNRLVEAAGGERTSVNWNDYAYAGVNLKSVDDWEHYSENTKGIDKYGFSALPGGYRLSDGSGFRNVGYYGLWWSATERGSDHAYYRGMGYNYDYVYEYYSYRSDGFSVRCVSAVQD